MSGVSNDVKDKGYILWTSWALRMPQALKDLLHSASITTERTMSELVRTATFEYLKDLSPTDAEIEAADISLRARKERVKLEKPKDKYKTSMKPFQAWRTILEEKGECEKYNVLQYDDYDAWVERLLDNKDSIEEDNPVRERILRRLDLLIAQLVEEQKKKFPEGSE